MEVRICNTCNLEKNITEFHKRKNGLYGRFAICKLCRKYKAAKNYQKNIDEMRKKSSEWRKNNPEKRKEVTANYRNNNKEKLKLSNKIYLENNKEKERERQQKYYQREKKKISERSKKYNKNRLHSDVLFKLKTYVRNRISKFLKFKKISKKNRTFEIVGCCPESLKLHIEKQFTEGMSWELMGSKIHIDHIIPLSSAKTEEEIYKLCHYTNLQPLWASDNLRKYNKIL
jgi:hypothetical protein